ncbi:hypothetical protein V491_00910 [Pseudogymnoascus sp. VKM F-3775]|nr:hypothetical protein V491_00910 [Pseudogymnoascus sp. VKM F-3775]
MPVKDPVNPRDGKELHAKLLAIEGSEEGNSKEGLYALMAEVKAHLSQSGLASYEKTIENDTRQVALPKPKCMVFLLKGAFKAGGVRVPAVWYGHTVEYEEFIELEENTQVVIINTN